MIVYEQKKEGSSDSLDKLNTDSDNIKKMFSTK